MGRGGLTTSAAVQSEPRRSVTARATNRIARRIRRLFIRSLSGHRAAPSSSAVGRYADKLGRILGSLSGLFQDRMTPRPQIRNHNETLPASTAGVTRTQTMRQIQLE